MLLRLELLSLLLSPTCLASHSIESSYGYSESGFAEERRLYPDLLSRASNDCSSGSFKSDVGITFEIYCDRSFDGDGFTGTDTFPDLDSCINACSYARPPCFAAIFDSSTGNCTYFNQTAAGRDTTTSTAQHTAIVNPATQLTNGFDTQCPYANGSSQIINGAEFTVMCGLDEPYNDFCPSEVSACPAHKESLADCLKYCTEAHPLCAAASWNPDLRQGYGNCYLKTNYPNKGFTVAEGDSSAGDGFWVHTGVATIENGSSIPYSCTDQAQISSNGKTFLTNCDANMANYNLTIVHENSLNSCIDNCATWSNGSCVGVVYDAQLTWGWENCFLKNGTNPLFSSINGTVALLSQGANTAHINSSHSSSGGSSHAGEISGSVVAGVVCFILLAIALGWWCRRRMWQRAGKKVTYPSFENQSAVPMEAKHQPVELRAGLFRAAELPEDQVRAEMEAYHRVESQQMSHRSLVELE